jgi:hypothetical protein
MPNAAEKVRRDWRIPDEFWARIQPLLPLRKPHPLWCHRPRVDDRRAMDDIFFVLRTAASGTPSTTPGSVPVVPPIAGAAAGVSITGWRLHRI